MHLSDFEEGEGWCWIRTASFHIVITILMKTGGDYCISSEVCHAASYRLLEIRGLLEIINWKIKMLWCYIILSYHQKNIDMLFRVYINISLCLAAMQAVQSIPEYREYCQSSNINETTGCLLFLIYIYFETRWACLCVRECVCLDRLVNNTLPPRGKTMTKGWVRAKMSLELVDY